MKKLLVLLALAALVVTPTLAREFTPYAGPYAPSTLGSRSDVELEYDGDAWYGYGTSPNWTDESVVNFQAPAGGPFVVAEVRYYVFGTDEKAVHFWCSFDLNSPPPGFDPCEVGPLFSTAYTSWPPADWTNVDVTGMGMVAETGDIIAPGCEFYGTDGIGLADAYADGNPGHSWVIYSGGWEDDTYVWDTDDGIRLGLNYGGGTPIEETTWGKVKSLFN